MEALIKKERKARLFCDGPRPDSGVHYRLDNAGTGAGVDLDHVRQEALLWEVASGLAPMQV